MTSSSFLDMITFYTSSDLKNQGHALLQRRHACGKSVARTSKLLHDAGTMVALH